MYSTSYSIWQERDFLTIKGTYITNGPLILKLLEASYLPKKIAVIHCQGHQAPTNGIILGNAFADRTAGEASQYLCLPSSIFLLALPSLTPTYSESQ